MFVLCLGNFPLCRRRGALRKPNRLCRLGVSFSSLRAGSRRNPSAPRSWGNRASPRSLHFIGSPRSKVSSLFAPAILKFAPVVPIEVFPLATHRLSKPEPKNHQPQLRAASGQGNLRTESTENVGGQAKLWKVPHLVYCVPTFSMFGGKSKAYEFAQRVSAVSAGDWDRRSIPQFQPARSFCRLRRFQTRSR